MLSCDVHQRATSDNTNTLGENVKLVGNYRVLSLNTVFKDGRKNDVQAFIGSTREWVKSETKHWARIEVPVRIVITATFKEAPVDADNLCVKGFIDGLKRYVLVDDSYAHVTEVVLRSRKGGADVVEIEVVEGDG